MVSTSSLKNLQKTKKCSFQMLPTFTFELKIALKPFYEKVLMYKFWFKKILTLCFTFPENGFKFVTQKLIKNWKMHISNAQNIRLLAQVSSKTIIEDTFYKQILIEIVLNALPHLPRKWFQLRHSKICKKLKNAFFQTQISFVFELKVAPKPFSKKVLTSKFWFN